MSVERWIEAAVEGERRSLARAISWIEAKGHAASPWLTGLSVRRRQGPGAPHVIGVTGPPGAGKSTLVSAWVAQARSHGERVAVLAVDPASPFSGGAILGDRIRMEEHVDDDGVYMRSLSSRGHLGGLSVATTAAVDLLDACGFDRVFVETVGVGQSELAIMDVADTVVVLVTPESGDIVQTMKAGLVEIADVFVVNKSDRPGGQAMVRALEHTLELSHDDSGWRIPVVQTVASDRVGLAPLVDAMDEHLAWCRGPGSNAWVVRRGRARVRCALDLVAEHARNAAARQWEPSGTTQKLMNGQITPHEAALEARRES